MVQNSTVGISHRILIAGALVSLENHLHRTKRVSTLSHRQSHVHSQCSQHIRPKQAHLRTAQRPTLRGAHRPIAHLEQSKAAARCGEDILHWISMTFEIVMTLCRTATLAFLRQTSHHTSWSSISPHMQVHILPHKNRGQISPWAPSVMQTSSNACCALRGLLPPCNNGSNDTSSWYRASEYGFGDLFNQSGD